MVIQVLYIYSFTKLFENVGKRYLNKQNQSKRHSLTGMYSIYDHTIQWGTLSAYRTQVSYMVLTTVQRYNQGTELSKET